MYSPGDEVHVETFGKGIVREARNGGRYLVEVKGRSMIVDGARLSAPAPRKRPPAPPVPSGSVAAGIPETIARDHAAASLDLHGMTRAEAISALDVFLDDAIRAGLGEVRVIHGRSGGRVRSAVHSRLERLPPVRGFRLDAANDGVTIVLL